MSAFPAVRSACCGLLILLCGTAGLARGQSEGDVENPKPARSPGVAFLMSAVLPGAGQLYNGDRRGYLYLGLEASAWFARLSYLDAGNKREGEYEAYARRHWSLDTYRASAGNPACEWTQSNDSLLVWFLDHDPQQYYEEIGKYDKYRCGWDDFGATYNPTDPRALSPNRKDYREMREQSNDLLDNARLALAISVVNRVVSGVDAFRTARARRSAQLGSQNVRLVPDLRGSWKRPQAVLMVVWSLP